MVGSFKELNPVPKGARRAMKRVVVERYGGPEVLKVVDEDDPRPAPGYELVGVVEELGSGCSRLQVGDRVAALMVWGADAERVCVPEDYAVEVPEGLDPAEVVSLVLPYMTAYQLLH